jgi:hypothetical protein
MAQAPAAFSRSSFTKGAAVGQFASGAVQEVGSMQNRLKEAGVEDTGYAPLAAGLVAGGLNVVADQVPLQTFFDAAGLDEGVKRSVMQVSKDTLKGMSAATVHGAGVGAFTGAAQNATEQAIHNEMSDAKTGVDGIEMIDNALRSALGMATLNPASHLAGQGYTAAAKTLKDYIRNMQDAGLAAAEKDFADETASNAGRGELPEDSRYSQFKAATDPNNPILGAKAEPEGAAEPTPPKQTSGAAIMAAFDQVEAEHAAQSAPEAPATDAVVASETTPVVAKESQPQPSQTTTQSDGDVRGLSYAITGKSGEIKTSGSIPSLGDPKHETSQLDYYRALADKIGGDLYFGETEAACAAAHRYPV